jgi:hypothetical protein
MTKIERIRAPERATNFIRNGRFCNGHCSRKVSTKFKAKREEFGLRKRLRRWGPLAIKSRIPSNKTAPAIVGPGLL